MIKNRKSKCRHILKIIYICMLISLSGCYEDDDFAPYTLYTDVLNEQVSKVDILSLSDIVPDADSIASRYCDGLLLTMVTVCTDDACLTGDVVFTYAKAHEIRNQVTKLKILYNIKDKEFYDCEFEQGHGKRVSVITEKVSEKYINMTFKELFALDELKLNALEKRIILELDFDRLEALKYYDTGVEVIEIGFK